LTAAEHTIIRAARIEDIARVLALWELARSEHASTADTAEDLQRLIGREPEALLLAGAGNEVCGTLIAA
jgi:ribosomal protein S18 acetylase RimI-like enzyme